MSTPSFRELERAIAGAMQADRHRLRRALRSLEQAAAASRPFDRNLARLEEEIRRSAAARASRISLRPKVEFDPALPVSAHREEIARAISQNQVVIVCGETGS